MTGPKISSLIKQPECPKRSFLYCGGSWTALIEVLYTTNNNITTCCCCCIRREELRCKCCCSNVCRWLVTYLRFGLLSSVECGFCIWSASWPLTPTQFNLTWTYQNIIEIHKTTRVVFFFFYWTKFLKTWKIWKTL